MLRFSDEGTVLNYGEPGAKKFDVQEKFKLELLRFCIRYGLLTVANWFHTRNQLVI